MAARISPDPAAKHSSGQHDKEPAPSPVPPEDHFHDWGEDDEPYTDPEHARRLAAVRTELFRRSQPRWEHEE
ncbi:MAG: hypothetical protein KF797_06790 [Flavobacteriales bacterium]|nr:hypothetical protein [Flavobacteriales bacterium]